MVKKIRSQKQKMFLESANRTPHYGIRKYTVGVASVLLSTTLWMGANGNVAHAETVDGSAATEQVNSTDPGNAGQQNALDAEKAASTMSYDSAVNNKAMQAADSQASTAEQAAKQSLDAGNVAADANQAENKQAQEVSANVEAQAQTSTANDAQADVAKQEPVAQNQQAAPQAQAPAEGQATTAEQATDQTSVAVEAGNANTGTESTETGASAADTDNAKQDVATTEEQAQANESANADAANDATTEAKNDSENEAAEAVANVSEDNGSDAAEDAKTETTTLDVSQAFKTSDMAAVNKKMVMASLASTKLADRYEAKGATKTVIYGQTIDPNSLIENFSSLPTGTTASAANLDSIKSKTGRNVVPVTVTYSDGSTDTADAIVWVTPQGTTALAKSVTLKSNETWDKESVTVDAAVSVPLEVYLAGTAVLSVNTIKKGSRIYFGTIDQKYKEYLGHNDTNSLKVTDQDNNVLGNLKAVGEYNHIDLYLDITTSDTYSGDVTVKFDFTPNATVMGTDQNNVNYRLTYLTNTDDPYDYSGNILQKRWMHTMGNDDKEWTINRTVPEIKSSSPAIPSTGAGLGPYFNDSDWGGSLFGYEGGTFNPNQVSSETKSLTEKIVKEIWASGGKIVPSDMPAKQNLHEVWQYTTPPGTYETVGAWSVDWGMKQLATENGQPSNQYSRLSGFEQDFKVFPIWVASKKMSIQELYDSTPVGKIGFAKEADDTYLICFNLTADDFTTSTDEVQRMVQQNAAAALSKDYEKILQANIDMYVNNAVPSFGSWGGSFLVFFSYPNDEKRVGKYFLQDVTPGHNAYTTSSLYTAGSASAGGESRLMNTAYFVDDSQNQAIVGGQHQISGKKGDTVPLNLTVPSGYILANGQALPTSYTFTGSDSDIVIHLVPIYKAVGQTSDVHRTIDYKTTDGSPAPETKSDDLKFYGTTVTGDLSNLTNRAGQDGLTVTKGDAKAYADKQEAFADLNKQASDIQGKVTKYEAEKAAYDAAKKVYDENLAKWKAAESSNDPHTVKGVSQSLSFADETDADLDVTSGTDKPVNFIKSSAWLGDDGKGVYNYANITKSFGDSDISYSRAEGTGSDSNGWGKSYTGIQLKTGESIVARYTGLKNSIYVDSTGAAHKLSKVQIKYTLNSTTANDGTANVFLSNNPNIALWYGAAAGKSDGSVDLTVDLTFYDENGNPITLGKGSNVWLNMGSLNRSDDKIEYFAPNGNTTVTIPGSTIDSHADGWYANEVNEGNSADWDKSTAANRYYGAAIMELEGNAFHIGQKITGSHSVYSWNAFDSSLATAYKPVEPKEPDKPNIAWHEVTNTTWDGPKDFADVNSPTIKGYTADKAVVSDKNVAHDHPAITETVLYTPDAQKATVTYIDDETGKNLKVENLTGVTNAKSGYTTAEQIKVYEGQWYQLVSDDTAGNEIVFDDDDSKDQAYTVHFKHVKRQINDEQYTHHVTVTRTITYKMSDGSTPPAAKTDSLSFTGQDTVDGVTGQVVKTDWTDAQNFNSVTSPTIAGYTPDRSVVGGVSVTHESNNITETVTYTADKQAAHVAYVDDTTGKTLKTDDLEGASNSQASTGGKTYTTADSINGYIGQGYKLISDSTNGSAITFDTTTGVDQYYTVHLAHDSYTKDVADDVHRTIVYVVKGGNHSAPSPVGDNLHFTGVQTYDKVNNNLLKTDWEPNKDFADVTSPEIKGYIVDRTVVSNRNIAHDAADITVTVTYTADTQKATVAYVDDTTGKTLKTDNLTGDSDTTATSNGVVYTTADSIKTYVGQGYKLVSDGTKGATILFDDNTGENQAYEVHFVHDTYKKAVSDDVHRTVHYVVKGGNHAAPEDVEADLLFKGKQTWDSVTKTLLTTDWEPNKDFVDVDTPEIQGYTADKAVVSNKNIGHDHADITETVTYKADTQKAHVRYHDDTDNKDLKTVDLEGDSDTTAYKDGAPYTTAASINGYVKQGYKLVSDNTDGATIMLDHLTGIDQFYEVHLVHDTYKKLVSDDVHRTVHYVVKGGNHAAPEDVEADLLFRGVQTYDKVNNNLLKTDWEPNKDFTDVDTPEIQGYTADKNVVSNRNIAHDHADITETVTYAADKQAAHVRFVDDTDNKTLKTTNLTGDSDTLASLDGKTPYTTEAEINYYVDRGYAKVSDDTYGMTIMLDHVTGTDQYYSVHLVHTYQTITSKNPGKPGQPINPKGDPALVWPDDTGAKDLQSDVHRTVNYVVAGGMDKAPESVHDLLHFEETRVYDKATGKLISDEWSPKQDFKDITSPSITGYTVDRKVVSNKDIEHDHPAIVETVTYNPDAQKAFVTYVDHTTGDTLAIKELDGKTHAKSGYTTYPSIVYYQGLGYQFISDTTDGKEIVYDNDDAVDQYYTVYLEHSYVPASPQNPGKPGEPINQNPDGAKWPDGTDANSLQHDVNRTINYVVTGGKDPAPASVHDKLHFEAMAMVDRVTGEIVSTKWDEDKDFADVKSPSITGYTVDRKVVSNKDIEHDGKDITETVTYNPDAQRASVTYVDKTTGKTLKVDNLNGVTHADSGYNTKGAIAVYTGLGYTLVSDTTNGTNVIFDNDDSKDQAFAVTLEHTYVTVTPKDQIKEGTPINPGKGSATYTEDATPEALQHDVKRNIHYVVSNGKKQAPADVNDSLHYEASAVIDKVTGDVVKTTWSGSQDFKDVASPTLKGYTVDKTLISNKNIGHDHADIKEIVTYVADAQKAYVTYIDDTTGKNLDIKVLKGFTLDDSGYNTKSDIKSYVDLGYDLVSDSSNGAEIIFDDEDGVDQTYTVHLAHGKITVTEEKPGKPGEPINPGKGSANYPDGTDKASLGKDVVRTITYKMVDGSKAPEGTSQTLHFTASKVIDKVTGQVLSTTWSGTQDFKDVVSPAVKGYTPDQKVISDKGITHEHSNIDEVVTYVPDPQKALVTYYDDTTGKVLKADSLVGVTNKDSGYTTKGSIAGFINLGFKLISDETGGKSIVFDNDDASDQAYKVHLAHDYVTVTPTEPGKPGQPINPDANGPKYPEGTDVKGLTDTVNREIDYVMSDGSKAPSGVKDTLSFTAKKTIDKATGEVVKTEWSANQDFKDVASPSVKGYTPDTKTVSNKDVAHDAADIAVTVKYSADAQKASVAYIDDKTGKTLKVDNLNGVTNAKSGYTTKSAIDTYTGLGYTLVSDDTNGKEIVFDNDDAKDQAFTVHLSHGMITVTPENPGKPGEPINPGEGSANYPDDTDVKGLTDTVSRTITYVMADGSKAPDAVHDSLSYTASKVIDKVTGQVLSTTWSKNQDFKDVDSPAVAGYTPDTKTVSNKDVAHDAADIAVTVKYNADAQKATVAYIDDKTGKTLKVDNLNGVTNAKSGYTTKSAIDTYTGLGYTLVSDDTNGKEIVFDNDDAKDQAFTVHLSHGMITVTPENPGKPGEPINPGEGSANYPDGTDKAGLTSTVTRTITYKMSDGSKAPDEVRQSLYFTGEKTIDKVTGQVLETKWSANQDFDDVDSPVIAGYTASLLKASDKNISHDDLNIFVSVVYKADKQKATVSYIDDTTGKTIETKSLTGVSNEHSGYSTISTIKDLENRGYKLVSDDTTGSEIVFDTDDAKDQAYSVHLEHGVTTVTPESPKNPVNGSDMTDRLTKKVHQTIKYVKANGKRAAKSNVQTLTFGRNAMVDLVDGTVVSYTDWDGPKSTKAVKSPAVKGFKPDKKAIESQSYKATDSDKTFTVTYNAVKKAAKPSKKTGKMPAPKAPAKETKKPGKTPAPAKTPANVSTHVVAKGQPGPVVKAAPAGKAAAKGEEKQGQAALPQTGEDKTSSVAFGLGLASILGGLGILGAKRKKKEN